jgi:hypothetical protein
MINLPLNFSAPTGQVQNTYAAPARTNAYLTPSQYEGMQLHTPSGLFYQGGNVYEPYTAPQSSRSFSRFFSGFSPFGMPRSNNASTANKDILTIGTQSFKPFTGNAPGIIDGNLSMVSMLNQQPMYQPQALPNLFSNLNSSLTQPTMLSAPSFGAGRFTGLLNSPIVTTNTQGK